MGHQLLLNFKINTHEDLCIQGPSILLTVIPIFFLLFSFILMKTRTPMKPMKTTTQHTMIATKTPVEMPGACSENIG